MADDDVCPRPEVGSVVQQPPEIRSQNGRLELTLNFRIAQDSQGAILFCYMSSTGMQAPTLRVHSGDELIIHFHNELPGGASPPMPAMKADSDHCADAAVTLAATNLHFHGLNIPPRCHQDDVMHTLIAPATSFDYRLKIPANTAPGLYWYHPHPHPFGEAQLQGGASGALIVEGISEVHPELKGLPERIFVLRDQKLAMRISRETDPHAPGWDISLNYVPVVYPAYVPAVVETTAGKEFWRVLNAAADTILDLQVIVNNAPLPLHVLAIDGVPLDTNSAHDSPLDPTDVLVLPGGRVEFVLNTPKAGDHAELVTRKWDTGPDGDNDPARPIATIISATQQAPRQARHKATMGKAYHSTSLRDAVPDARRKLYFSEDHDDPKFATTSFYLTVDGATPARFSMEGPPNMVAHQGTIEDWTIENRSREEHVFHIHQVHFQVVEKDGKPVNDPALRDTVDVPYWKGEGPYPSVTLRVDFRDANTAGLLMFHCHILQHSSNGMMGSVLVLPKEH